MEDKIKELELEIKRLKESEEKFRYVFENSPVGKSFTGVDGSLCVNKAFSDILGYSLDELKVLKWQDITYPDDINESSEIVAKLLNEKISFARYIKRYIHKNGQIIWADVSTSIQRNADGNPLYFITNIIDITERRLGEEMVRKSESLLKETQKLAHLGFWNWDIKTGNVVWSEEVYKIFGLDPEKFTPHINSILDLSPWPEDHQRDKELINRAIETHEPGSYEQKFLRPDQSIGYYYSTFLGKYDKNGSLISIVGTVLDVTERKQAEEALKQHNEGLINLNRFYIESSILSVDDDLEALITRHIKEIAGAEVAIFNEYDAENRTTCVKHIEMEPGLLEKVVGLLGKQVKKIKSAVSEDLYKEMTTEIIGVRRTLYEASFGSVSRPVSAAIQALLKVDRFIGLAYILDGKLYGTTLLAMGKGRPDPPKEILENFINIAALSMRRRRTEEALRESENKFKYIFDNSSVGKSLTKPNGEISVNQAFCDMLGFTKGELIKRTWQQLTHPEDILESQKWMDEIISGKKESAHYTKRFIHKNGAVVWAEVNSSLRRDKEKNPLYFITVIINITERKQAEQLLKRNERHYRVLAENMVDMVCVHDLKGYYKFMSPSVSTLLGYDANELINTNPLDIVHPNDKEVYLNNIRPVILAGEYWSHECRYIRKDGSSVWVEVNGKPVRDENNVIISYQTVTRNITERKLAEEKLDKSKALLREAEKTGKIGGFEFFVDSLTQNWTEETFHILEIDTTKGEPKVPDGIEFIEPEFRPMAESAIKNAIELGEPYDQEWIVTTAKGNKRWVHSVGKANYENDKIVSVSGCFQDITERKLADEALINSENKFRAIFDRHSAAIAIIEPDTTISMVNEAYCKLSGYTEQEVVGMSWTKQITPDDIERLKEYNRRRLTNPNDAPHEYEFSFYNKKGEIKYAMMSVGMIFSNKKIIASFIDVTQRKQAEEAMRESENKFRNLVETTSDIIWETNTNGVFTYISPQVENILGYKPKEIMGHSPFDFMPTDEAKKIKKISDEIVISEKSYNGLININLTKDGRHIIFETSGVPIFDANKNLLGFRGIDRDITERKLAENNLHALSVRQEAMLFAVPEIIMEVDINKIYKWANKNGLEFFGEDVIGHEAADYFEGEQDTYKNVQSLFDGNENLIYVESWQRRMDGEKRLLAWYCTPVKDINGNISGTLSSARDITDNKLAEEALRESTEQYKAISEYSNNAICIVNENAKIEWVNDKMMAISGYTAEQILGAESFVSFLAPESIEFVVTNFKKMLMGEEYVHHYEFSFIHANGEKRILEKYMMHFTDKNGKPKLIINMTDITGRLLAESMRKKHLEEQLLLSEVAGKLVSLEKLEEIYDYIGKTITGLIPDSLIFLSTYIPERKTVKINHSFGFNRHLKSIIDMMGIDPFKLEIGISEMSAEELKAYKSRALVNMPGGLYALSARKIKKSICNSIEKLLGVSSTYTMGFSWNDKLYGGLTVLLRKEIKIENIELVETIINQTAIAIQRRIGQEELGKSEEKYRMLAENATDIVWVLDISTGKFTYISQAVEKIRGYTVEEAMEIPFSKSLTPENYQLAMKDLSETLKQDSLNLVEHGRIRTYQFEEFHKNGSIVSTESNLRLLRDEKGKPYSIIGVTRDITDRKKALEALAESEKKYRVIAEKTTDVIWLMDLEGKSIFVTPSIEKFTGFTVDEYLRQKIEERFTPSSAKYGLGIFAGELQAYRSSKEYLKDYFFTMELEYICKDQSAKWGELLITPFYSEEKELLGIHGVTRDITDRKMSEKALDKKVKELEEFNDLMVGRENKMVELKKEINELLKKMGQEEKYEIVS
jgi:PAS domain S-box-containing protein